MPIIAARVKILVTGAAGCLGSALTDALLVRGHEVTGVDVAPLGRTPPRPFPFVHGSFGAAELPGGLDAIAHLACSSVPATSATSPEMDIAENVLPGVDLFRRAARAGVRRIVFTSSGGTVYGELPADRAAWTEADACRPTTAHGAMKHVLETYLRAIAQGTGLRTVTARIANAYGRRGPPRPGHGAVDSFVRAVERGDEIHVWGDGSTVRDYVHTADIVAALVAMLEAERPSEVFNVATGHGTSLRELIATVEEACGRRAKVRFEPSRGVDLARNVLDARLAREELGWSARLDLAAGVARVVAEARGPARP